MQAQTVETDGQLQKDVESGNFVFSSSSAEGEATVAEETKSEKAPSTPPPPPVTYPDGGIKAWGVIFGCFWCNVFTFGWINSFGVLQSYYSATILEGKSQSQVSWVGSFNYFLILGMGLVAGRAFDLGLFKPVSSRLKIVVAREQADKTRYQLMAFSMFLWVLAQMMVSLCSTYAELFVVSGLLLGLAEGLVFNLAVNCPAQWFHKRRALAIGVQAAGSSVGGTVLPIAVQRLLPRIGFGWTMRLVGFLGLFFYVIAYFCMDTRLPPVANVRNGGWKKVKWVDGSAFKSLSYTLFTIGATLVFLGIYNVFTYMDVFATEYNIPQGQYMIPIMNAASTFGRIIPGFFADKVGRFNMCM